jgi:phosphoenolpyruvate synthase/pyruvate phosphate dikinase
VFKRLEGELVKLTVASQDYGIEPAEREEAEAAWAAMRPTAALVPERDLAVSGLFDVELLRHDAIRYVGAKAAQLGQLCGTAGVVTPGGFAVPFSAYAAHLDSGCITDTIDSMLLDPDFRGDAAIRAVRLARLRAAIIAHPVAPGLVASIGERLRANSACGRRFIFRSSTNAEDLAGFNGAGLYESTVVAANPTDQQIADALRFVWASVWLRRAYKEREWYRIDHREVAMAILIQPFVERAVATGVAITGNPFKESLRAVFINSQANGASVTGAIGNELPEQYLVAIWAGEYEPELLSHSSLTYGAAILHDADLRELTNQLVRIHDAMLPVQSGSANAMDVEFALTAERQFIIVQARPYNIVYSLDRARPVTRDRSGLERVMYRVRRFAHRWSQRTVAHRRLEASGR